MDRYKELMERYRPAMDRELSLDDTLELLQGVREGRKWQYKSSYGSFSSGGEWITPLNQSWIALSSMFLDKRWIFRLELEEKSVTI